MSSSVESFYNEAILLATSHYENFPVVSFFTPKHLRKHIAVIYYFARTADDCADEGDVPSEERIENLNKFFDIINRMENECCEIPWEAALASTMREFNIPFSLLKDLISAFTQDVVKKEYSTRVELNDYAARSANPIGRIILYLHGITDEHAFLDSDRICTALQFINFLQDVSVDAVKGRCYIPADELMMFGMDNSTLWHSSADRKKNLIRYMVEQHRNLLYSGIGLERYLTGKLKYQIRWTLAGGNEILSKIKKIDYNVFEKRVSLSKFEFFSLILKSLFNGRRKLTSYSP